MFKWLAYLRAVPQIIGFIRGVVDLVKHAEDLLGGGDNGARKKAVVLGLLDTAVSLGEAFGIPEAKGVDRDKLQAGAATVIDAVVAVLNGAGVFKHAGQ